LPRGAQATKGGIAIVRIESSCGRLYHRDSGIQNGGVIRMSGMSSMLGIPLYREASVRNEPNERGGRPLGTLRPEKLFLLSFSSLREGA